MQKKIIIDQKEAVQGSLAQLIMISKHEIINLIEDGYHDPVHLSRQLALEKSEFLEIQKKISAANELRKDFNFVVKEVLQDGAVIENVRNSKTYRNPLYLLISLVDRKSESFGNCAARYLDLLDRYYCSADPQDPEKKEYIEAYMAYFHKQLVSPALSAEEKNLILDLKQKLHELFPDEIV